MQNKKSRNGDSMIIINRTIAQKYATALFNIFEKQFTPEAIDQLLLFQAFLRKSKSFFAYLSISSIDEKIKQAAIEKITTHFRISFLANLILLLLKHKRINLLPLIISQSIKTHQKKHQISLFTIKTSHALQEAEKQRIINFIQKDLGQKKILPQFFVYPGLISGLRIKSDGLLWERSIKRTLQQIKQSLFQRVGL